MNLTDKNSLPLISQFIIPLLVLLNVYFFLFDVNVGIFFSQIKSILFFHIFMVFTAVKVVNAFLLLFGHNKKKYLITLLWLILIQFVVAYGYYGIINIEGSKLFHQVFFLKWSDSFLVNIIVDSFFLILCGYAVVKEQSSREMNRYFKFLLYLFIPYVFYFTFSKSFNYVNYDNCLAQFDRAGTFEQQELEHPLLGKSIDKIPYFSSHIFDQDKKYIVYLMDSDCKRCWRGINNIKGLATLEYELIFYDVGKNVSAIQLYGLDKQPHYYPIVFEESLIMSFPDLPTTMIIENNKIKQLFIISTPSTYELLF